MEKFNKVLEEAEVEEEKRDLITREIGKFREIMKVSKKKNYEKQKVLRISHKDPTDRQTERCDERGHVTDSFNISFAAALSFPAYVRARGGVYIERLCESHTELYVYLAGVRSRNKVRLMWCLKPNRNMGAAQYQLGSARGAAGE